MNKGIYLFLFPVIIGVMLVTFIAGSRHGRQQHALEETKLLSDALIQSGGRDLGNQFREYAKGRVYWNTYLYLHPDQAESLLKDFGAVNLIRLGKAEYRKEPIDHESIRTNALKKVTK